MEIKAGTWFKTERQKEYVKLYHVLEVKNGNYTIKQEMSFIFGSLFIASDEPKRRFQWSDSSMGLQEAEFDVRDFISYIFTANEIGYSVLNGD